MNKILRITQAALVGAILYLGFNMAAAAERSPEQTIRAFYGWYLEQLDGGQDPFTDGRKQMQDYVSDRLIKEVEAKREAGEMDADYFLNAQDFDKAWGKDIEISDLEVKGEKASANVELKSSEMGNQKLKVQLGKEGGAWKIDAVSAT